MFKSIVEKLKKILVILSLFILFLILLHLVYCLLAISYLILDNFYIMDRANSKSGYFLSLVAVYVYITLFSAGEHLIYSYAIDSGEVAQAERAESIQGFRGSNDYSPERHVPIASTSLVRFARRFKLVLDRITILFISKLIPTFFKLIYVAVATSCETTRYVVRTVYQWLMTYCRVIRRDFADFRRFHGIQVLSSKARPKPGE